MGVRKTFETGLESRGALKSESVDSNSTLITGMNPYYRSYIQLDLAQPVLRLRGPEEALAVLDACDRERGEYVASVSGHA